MRSLLLITLAHTANAMGSIFLFALKEHNFTYPNTLRRCRFNTLAGGARFDLTGVFDWARSDLTGVFDWARSDLTGLLLLVAVKALLVLSIPLMSLSLSFSLSLSVSLLLLLLLLVCFSSLVLALVLALALVLGCDERGRWWKRSAQSSRPTQGATSRG